MMIANRSKNLLTQKTPKRVSSVTASINMKHEDTDDCIDDIKEDSNSQNMDNIDRSLTCESIDSKDKDTDGDDCIDDIKEDGISQNMDEIRENYSCNNIHIKVEESKVSMDDTCEADISYNHDGIEQQHRDGIGQQHHEEAERRQDTGKSDESVNMPVS